MKRKPAQSFECRQKKKKAKLKQLERQDPDSYVKIVCGDLTLFNNERKCMVKNFDKDSTLCDVFIQLCPFEIIDYLMKEHLGNKEFPESMTTPRNETRTCKQVYTYLAQRIYLTGNGLQKLGDNFPMKKWNKRALNEKYFSAFIANFHFDHVAAEMLNDSYSNHVQIGRTFVIDEKLKPFSGPSESKLFVPGKKPSVGHWITEMAVVIDDTDIPFLVNQSPATKDNKRNSLDIFKKAVSLCSKDHPSIIVADAYYLDNPSRDFLCEQQWPYVCCINKQRFKRVWSNCESKMNKSDGFVLVRIKETKEIAMMGHFGKKKKCVLTSCFAHKESKRMKPFKINTVSDAYRQHFNVCDRFNHFLKQKYWRYRRCQWQNSFDDFYFSALLMNTYSAWHDLKKVPRMTWRVFTNQLSKSLMDWLDTQNFCLYIDEQKALNF